MKHSLLSLAATLAASLILSGCNSSGSETAANGDNSTDGAISMQKVFVDEATLEQIAPHKKECKGADKDHKICVEICHRPPGNPKKGKSKILPLGAVCAHLNHGHSDIKDADYVGPCHSDDNDSDNGGGGDDGGSSDDGSGEGEDGSDGGDTTGDIPTWCQPYIDIDSDCDGIIDATGDPLL